MSIMRLRVVVFDDEAVIRNMLRELCEQRGYEVFTFPDPGLCPLHVVSGCVCPGGATCADIIISDVNMLSVNGLDFVEDLLQKNCRAPNFALMSGGWTDLDLARASRLKCSLFTKPFQIAHIIAWFEQVEARVSPNRRLIDWSSHQWS